MNDLELVLLSVVAETPRYVHEIQQVIARRKLRRWVVVGDSSLHYVLGKLEKDNLIKGEFPYESVRSARKRYSITQSGLGLLKTTVIDRLTQSRGGMGSFEIGLLLAIQLSPRQVQDALYQRRIDLARQIEQIQHALENLPEPENEKDPDVQKHLYERNRILLEHDFNWLTEFEEVWAIKHAATLEAKAVERDESSMSSEEADDVPDVKKLQQIRRPRTDL